MSRYWQRFYKQLRQRIRPFSRRQTDRQIRPAFYDASSFLWFVFWNILKRRISEGIRKNILKIWNFSTNLKISFYVHTCRLTWWWVRVNSELEKLCRHRWTKLRSSYDHSLPNAVLVTPVTIKELLTRCDLVSEQHISCH